ncbi:hypothetical protein BTO05_07735 [Winogradskyella sp. PC-19]|uniref:DUF2975 domain-containing protein n=1 Tax=unclassified Winogradskyella TaxID=2615021 RepID=UPI000B3D3AFC|nr:MULTISPECIES: DUF2975 domain-containing protein [unclassified Winogradskyella]ARV09536.1 hypothetical protein BTO05_07735 [Winogradskyella sp. PC-19]RZN83730.1 MAG: DUF2975 domain-containing protein [Winogradskyella sp.]
MNSARTLYLILNTIIILLLVGIGLGVFIYIMMLFGVEQDFIGIDMDKANFKTEVKHIFYTILRLGVYAIFIKALWNLRKVIKLFLNKDFYNSQLITLLLTSGKLMVITGVSGWCIDAMSDVFFKFRFTIGISETTLAYLFIIAVGLFLMLISTVLRDTKAIKEENDLTI